MKRLLLFITLIILGLLSISRVHVVDFITNDTGIKMAHLDPDGNPTDNDTGAINMDNIYALDELLNKFCRIVENSFSKIEHTSLAAMPPLKGVKTTPFVPPNF